MHFEIADWPLTIAFCAFCYLVSALAMTRSAAYLGLTPKLTKALPWITSGAKQDSSLRKVRIAGVGVVAFLMASYVLYLIISAR